MLFREDMDVIQYIKCFIGLHRVFDTHYCKDGELTVCRHCLKAFEN